MKERGRFYVVFLADVDLAPSLANPKLLVASHLADFAIMFLVAYGRRGGQHEGSTYDDCHERQPEEKKRVPRHHCSVAHADLVCVRGADELALREDGHCGRLLSFPGCVPSSVGRRGFWEGNSRSR